MGEAAARGRFHNQKKTHCKHGHPLSGENLYMQNGKYRVCLTCRRANEVKAFRKRRAKFTEQGLTCRGTVPINDGYGRAKKGKA